VPTSKVSLSVPSDVLADAERRLARPGESRSALFTRLLTSALREMEEREAEECYLRGYHQQPESEDELRINRTLSRSLLER
jgi:metal-responsive CopG/Arc/MetJ family transcriptional regulator